MSKQIFSLPKDFRLADQLKSFLKIQMTKNITSTMTIRAVHIPASKISPTNSQPLSVNTDKARKVKKKSLKFFIVIWLKAKFE